MMKVFEHDHPLKLIDLQVSDIEDVEESDDEEDELVIADEFSCTCKRCHKDINEYSRYYYTCTNDSCDFSLHKFCTELPTTIKYLSCPDPLTFNPHGGADWSCGHCNRHHKGNEVRYTLECHSFNLDVNCVVESDKKRIYHPSHPHPLMCLISDPILCFCVACFKKHEGVFLQCVACTNFAIHRDCAFLPKRLLIQRTTNGFFSHKHPLTISYSFPLEQQEAEYFPSCRVCSESFVGDPYVWTYKCQKCMYYTHLDCATSRIEPFMHILSTIGPVVKNFRDEDYPNLVHLPFPDQAYSLPKHLFLKKHGPSGTREVIMTLQRMNQQHELTLIDTECIGATSSEISSLIMCHNPMKKIQLLCNACVRPITETPFYKCGANHEDERRCNFALHEWCTQLPTKVDHSFHRHPLVLMTNVPHAFFNVFCCKLCALYCNGYAYGCIERECEFYVDVTCAFLPENITHKYHPDHIFSIAWNSSGKLCFMCHRNPFMDWMFKCNTCDVYIHLKCALLIPETIRHAYDKHLLRLRYLPAENHTSEYFCEICENGLNPNSGYYHCVECAQSIHSTCAPLILCCETETFRYNNSIVYMFINVKFGSIHKINSHPHPLSFAQGIENDGDCDKCGIQLQYELIFKCVTCKFAIHYNCCKHLNM